MLSTSRKPVFGYRAMVYAISRSGCWVFRVFSPDVHQRHEPFTAIVFSIVTLTIGPSAIKTFNWLGTLWGGQIRFTTPMLFAIDCILFVSGGITGLLLGQTSIDIQLHDTYFVVAHPPDYGGCGNLRHLMGTYWFPKMFSDEREAKLHSG